MEKKLISEVKDYYKLYTGKNRVPEMLGLQKTHK